MNIEVKLNTDNRVVVLVIVNPMEVVVDESRYDASKPANPVLDMIFSGRSLKVIKQLSLVFENSRTRPYVYAYNKEEVYSTWFSLRMDQMTAMGLFHFLGLFATIKLLKQFRDKRIDIVFVGGAAIRNPSKGNFQKFSDMLSSAKSYHLGFCEEMDSEYYDRFYYVPFLQTVRVGTPYQNKFNLFQ